MGPSGRFTHVIVILMLGTGYMQVLYLGRAPRTKETLPDFREKCRVTRHLRVCHGLTGSQRTPGFGAHTNLAPLKFIPSFIHISISLYLLLFSFLGSLFSFSFLIYEEKNKLSFT